MTALPAPIAAFLSGKRYAVTGVSRDGKGVANAIFRKLRNSGFTVVPVNPHTAEAEGTPCYRDIANIPGPLHGVVIASAPGTGLAIIKHCAERGVKHVWFHRSFGQGSFSQAALDACAAHGIAAVAAGCPMMYLEPVDGGHKCFRWWLKLLGKVL